MHLETPPHNGSRPSVTPAPPTRRELPLVVGDRTYRLVESMNAYCVLEETLQVPLSELVLDAANGSMRATRGLLWAHLQIHHRSDFPTMEQAGDLVDVVGIEAVWQQLRTLAGVESPSPAPASRQVRRARARKAAQ